MVFTVLTNIRATGLKGFLLYVSNPDQLKYDIQIESYRTPPRAVI